MSHHGRRALLAALAVALVVGSVMALASAAAGKPPATANNPVITFVAPSPAEGATLTTSAATFSFTYSKKPNATRTLTCSLAGPTPSSGPCTAPVAEGSKGSKSGKAYTGLANGSYTLTVSLTLSDGGTASATRQFTVNAPQPILARIFGSQSFDYRLNVDFRGTNAPSGDVMGIVHGVEIFGSASGCEPAAFLGFPAGSIALVERGTCEPIVKVNNAAAFGAVAVIFMNDDPSSNGTVLFDPEVGSATIPVLTVTFNTGVDLFLGFPFGTVRVKNVTTG